MDVRKLRKLNKPSVYIPLVYAILCLCTQQAVLGIAVLIFALALLGMNILFAFVLRKEKKSDLPSSGRAEKGQLFAALGFLGLFVLFGVIYASSGLFTLAVLRDLTASLAMICALGDVEHGMAAGCIAMNVYRMRCNEILEAEDNPYLLGKANVAVINPDIFTKSALLPPKFFYCGSIRHMSTIGPEGQKYLLQAVISCSGEGSDPGTWSELLFKNGENMKGFNVLEQTEENGLVLSRQEYCGTPVTFIKGSCENLAPKCSRVLYDGQFLEMNEEELKKIYQARIRIKDRGCRTFAYAMYSPDTGKSIFLGLVGFGISRERNLKKTVSALRDAGMQICFAGTGGRETVFGLAEACGLSVTRFMTGRELSGRITPPESGEIASHRLFTELTRKEMEQILEAFSEEGWHPALIGNREIECDGASVRAGFSGKESCEKLLMCVKLRRSAERTAAGFAAFRRMLAVCTVLWPLITGIVLRRFICPAAPVVVLFASVSAWAAALCVSLMNKNSETPKDMGADRKKNRRRGIFADACWVITMFAVAIPLVSFPIMEPEKASVSVSLSAAALIVCAPLVVFVYACGIGIRPVGLIRKHPLVYGVIAAVLVLTMVCFTSAFIASGLGFSAVSLNAWRFCIPYALVPLAVLFVFMFSEWLRGSDKGIRFGEVR